jgi:anthranilate phosphoribosyltransferase
MVEAVTTALRLLADRHNLSEEQAFAAIEVVLSGDVEPVLIAGLLMGLRAKGETVEELVGAARAMRSRVHIDAPFADAVDTCGTGGDGAQTLNISTAAAFIAAGAGAKVAKHGNRAVSSRSGSSDVLAELGVAIAPGEAALRKCLAEVGMAFFFAPAFHSAVRHVAPIRQTLKVKTIFNLLGPLCNPAGVRRQVIGVFSQTWLEPLALAQRALGAQRALIVHGRDRIDELTVCGLSDAIELAEDGHIKRHVINPNHYGLNIWPPGALAGGDPPHNAQAIRELVAGAKGAYRDAACLNAGATLWIAGVVDTLSEGVEAAQNSIDTGKAADTLHALITLSQAPQA